MKTLCIYCGSSAGRNDAFREHAANLGRLLAARGIGVVYGGASVGLMGAVADAALSAGGRVTGVIPSALLDRELSHGQLTELHVVASMHERKRLMADLSDGFIALPGGLGTLEELFEILTWAQLGFHGKPVGVLNVADYYTALLTFLDEAVSAGFVRPEYRGLLLDATDAPTLLERFQAFAPPARKRWLSADET